MSEEIQVISEVILSDNVLSALILLLIASIFINLRYAHQKVRRHLAVKHAHSPKAIKKFLDHQAEESGNVPVNPRLNHLDSKTMRFRSAYLAIESKCIERNIDSDAYWDLLNTGLTKLLIQFAEGNNNETLAAINAKIRLIKEEVAKTDNTAHQREVLSNIDRLQLACINNHEKPEILAHYNEKLGKLLLKLRNANYRRAMHVCHANQRYIGNGSTVVRNMRESSRSFGTVAHALDDQGRTLDAPISGLIASNDSFYESVSAFARNLSRNREDIARVSYALNASADSSEIDLANAELRDLSEQIIEASESEIARLKEKLLAKKHTIIDLEDRIGQIRSEQKAENQSLVTYYETEIQSLRRHHKEAEDCVKMLDSELEKLREQHRLINVANDANDQPPLSDKHMGQLQETVSDLECSLSIKKNDLHNKEILLNYITESLTASTIEDYSLSIHQCIQDLGFTGCFLIYGNSRTLEVSETGAVSNRDKILINNMQIDEINTSQDGTKLNFRLEHFGGTLEKQDRLAIDTDEKIILDLFFRVTNEILALVKQFRRHELYRKFIDQTANDLKILTKNIDEELSGFIDNIDRLLFDTFRQIRDISDVGNWPEEKAANLRELERNSHDELSAESRIKLRLRKYLLKLLARMERDNI